MQLSIIPRRAMRFISSALLALTPLFPVCWAQAQPNSNKPIVFLIVIENKNAVGTGGVYGSAEAPYINKTLFPMAAVANNYIIQACRIICGWKRGRTSGYMTMGRPASTIRARTLI
jgi:hypothetical protein